MHEADVMLQKAQASWMRHTEQALETQRSRLEHATRQWAEEHRAELHSEIALARTEFSLSALAYNLKRAIAFLGITKTMKALKLASA